jgi:hypothetical protein
MLSLAPISNFYVKNAAKLPWSSHSVGIDCLPRFAVERSTEVSVPLLKFIFNLGLCQNTCRFMEVSSSCSCLLKRQKSSASNYKHTAIYKNYAKVF